jgi:hypothetical protein
MKCPKCGHEHVKVYPPLKPLRMCWQPASLIQNSTYDREAGHYCSCEGVK